jgi:hypothetical protein
VIKSIAIDKIYGINGTYGIAKRPKKTITSAQMPAGSQ